ncbi:GNAT family N-acetyltransferase [Fodinibius salsisoli]|uniref:GNAT family N-acetyltransferase n=1 Tax=Fodinibius salsisoli TaxID=2820877 RepID=A0ABT3PN66_9BACT|nr:GNAT family protein [Fodinibius salsisoli]MCW9707381.1 GNAT family N-acetyltransferase [Fodinibius salsisoli]
MDQQYDCYLSKFGLMVILKEFNLQNVSVHYKWNNDPKLSYYDSDYPFQPETFETFLKRIKSVISKENRRADLLEIHLENNDKLIGIVDLYSIDNYNNRCCVNCTIGAREYIGRGYEFEAIKETLNYCFNELGMHKVTTTAFDFNKDRIKQVKKVGFMKEGQLRKHVLKQDTFCDKLIFSLLKSEYGAAVENASIAAAH